MKYLIAITFLVLCCMLPLYAQPQSTELARRLERLSLMPENRMRNNDLNDPSHESLYTSERFRYNEKLKPSTNGQDDTMSPLTDDLSKNPKVEKNVRTLVSSMLGLMSGLLRAHLRDDQPQPQPGAVGN